MQVSGQLQTPAALSPEKEALVSTKQANGCVKAPLWKLWKGETSAATATNQTTIV